MNIIKQKINIRFRIILVTLLFTLFTFAIAQPGKLNVGFDIDDTVLFSEPMFIHYITEYGRPLDYSWLNSNDKDFSIPITPTIDLVHYFRSNGHNVFFITARPGENRHILGEFLTGVLGYKVEKDVNLFFMPKEKIGEHRFTTKHRTMNELELDLYYGDSDTDIVGALKAGVHPVRVVRSNLSLENYSANYFGNTHKGDVKEAPFDGTDLKIFYSRSVGVFGESIYPIIWDGPQND